MPRIRLGVIGVGHLGKEHARILSSMPDVELVGVVDAHAPQAELIAQRCQTRPFTDHRALLPLVDAAIIVTPTLYHHAVASEFLAHGVPVLVEKPLASDLPQAEELVTLATRLGVVLQVGHIERFNPAFEELQRRPLRPKLLTCERYSGFSGRSTDIGVVLDMMIHDLDIVLALVRSPVRTVDALGVSVLGGQEDLAQARVTFANGCVANFSASRVHPTSLRRMQLWGPEGFATVDFAKRHITLMQPATHLRFQRGSTRRPDPTTLASYKAELFTRHVETLEVDCAGGDQLTAELHDFVHCVRSEATPRVDGVAGRDAIALASLILDSARNHQWEGDASGPIGPWSVPAPLGGLFMSGDQQQVAA
jgi:predicted dehydrogenase